MSNYRETIRKIIKVTFATTVIIAACLLVIGLIRVFTKPENNGKDNQAKNSIEVDQVKNICKLATLECTYNDVAKTVKEPGEGLIHAGEKQRKLWIKYQVSVVVSYDINQVKMDQNGNEINIYLPEPEIESHIIESSFNEDSYVATEDNWLQKNKIEAEDQTAAIAESCDLIEDDVCNNTTLISTAEKQAKTLIENYISQMGEINNTEYVINWVDSEVQPEAKMN